MTLGLATLGFGAFRACLGFAKQLGQLLCGLGLRLLGGLAFPMVCVDLALDLDLSTCLVVSLLGCVCVCVCIGPMKAP